MSTRTKPKPRGLSASAAAAHFGVSRQTVVVWDRKGWVVRFKDRSIDVKATEVRVESKRDKDKARSVLPTARAAKSASQDLTPEEAQRRADKAEATPEDCDIDEAKRRKEYWTSEKVRLQVRQTEGEIVEVDKVRRTWASFARTLRSRFQAAPQRQAAALTSAGMIAPGVAQVALEHALAVEIDAVLSQVADEPPDGGGP